MNNEKVSFLRKTEANENSAKKQFDEIIILRMSYEQLNFPFSSSVCPGARVIASKARKR